VNSEEPTFTLGQEPTSPLELTGAFAAAANDGVYCPPHPVVRITTTSGATVALKRDACHRVLTPYVARTVETLMRKDTHSGTAASYFRGWYAHGGSDVAGKTGTDNDASDTGNSALWFVGSTPHLVAAASLVNPRNPKQTVHDLPGLPGRSIGQDVFGAYASKFWLDAYASALRTAWTWPSPSALPGHAVPRVIGLRPAAAAASLRSAGFRVEVFPVECASSRPAGVVAYQQPPRAAADSVVVVCLGSGRAAYVSRPPRVVYRPSPRVRTVAPPHRAPGGHGHHHRPGH
jgi:membrane peptidoglycan carboxypeptidase